MSPMITIVQKPLYLQLIVHQSWTQSVHRDTKKFWIILLVNAALPTTVFVKWYVIQKLPRRYYAIEL